MSFSIYKSPLSEETLKLRRNSVLASLISLFIGLTQEIPTKFALLGITFESVEKQIIVGWGIFFITLYLFLHFLSVAALELARWIHPLIKDGILKSGLLRHPAFDETDFLDINYHVDANEQDLNIFRESEEKAANTRTFERLKPLYAFVYVKLIVEVLVPLVLGGFALWHLWATVSNLK